MPTDDRPLCKYAPNCYRKNPQHIQEFRHDVPTSPTATPATAPSATSSGAPAGGGAGQGPAPTQHKDLLKEINGIRPDTPLDVGTNHNVNGSSSDYSIHRTLTHYFCSCPAWKNLGGTVETRTCKHLKELNGDDYEKERVLQAQRLAVLASQARSINDPLEEINGIKPLLDLKEDETTTAKSAASDSVYTIKRTADHYYCTCPAWRNAGGAVDARTCKHLKSTFGEAFEDARVERAKANAPPAPQTPNASASKKTTTASSKKKSSNKKRKSDDDDEDDEEDDTPARSTKKPKVAGAAAPGMLLAHSYKLGMNPKGWLISEKLDGVRALWDPKRRTFLSRVGNPFNAPASFVKGYPTNMTLDGELFGGRNKFQETVSVVRSMNSDKWDTLQFHVFDAPTLSQDNKLVFEDRIKAVQDFVKKSAEVESIKVVEHIVCRDEPHLLDVLKQTESMGGEGIMLRKPKSMYEPRRSSTLLKLKNFYDAEAVVVGYTKGKGKHDGVVGALEVKMANGTAFKIGTGMSDKDRANPPKKGAIVTYRFQELTKAGVPRFPTFVGERIDATGPKDAVVRQVAANGDGDDDAGGDTNDEE